MDRFAELQGLNRSLHQEVTQLRQQLTSIAEEKEAAAAAEKRRLTDQVKRRPERNRAFKVEILKTYFSSRPEESLL